MNKTTSSRVLSVILCLALLAAVALTAWGCTTNKNDGTEVPHTESSTIESSVGATDTGEDTEDSTEAETADPHPPTVKGEGSTAFFFNVVDKDGNVTKFEIHTDATTVGEALLELGLIEGDPGAYGLYVKKVNGITADYDIDGTYWAFSINGAYAMSGVDVTNVEAGATYEFKVSR